MNHTVPTYGRTARDLLKALTAAFDLRPRMSDKPTQLYAKAGQLEMLEKAEQLVNQWEENYVLGE